MFSRHFSPYIIHISSLKFLEDIFPILISGIALIVSVLTPYLIIRYEKAFTRNKEYKNFLCEIEVFLLEWLNVTSYNQKMTEEFIDVLKTPKAIFPKSFQFYEFPSLDFFNTYNIELLNECYVQVRKLKNLNHHLNMISSEYLFYRRMLVEKGVNKIENGTEFYIKVLEDIKKEYPKVINNLTELRIIVILLLKRANKINYLTMGKFFNLGPGNVLWHKKDISFIEEEIEAEKIILEKNKAEYAKKESLFT